jgi:hypothetical protein
MESGVENDAFFSGDSNRQMIILLRKVIDFNPYQNAYISRAL